MTNTAKIEKKYPEIYNFFNGTGWLTFDSIFSMLYIGLLGLVAIVTIAMPINKSIWYFRLVTGIFSFLTIITLIGIASYLAAAGFYP